MPPLSRRKISVRNRSAAARALTGALEPLEGRTLFTGLTWDAALASATTHIAKVANHMGVHATKTTAPAGPNASTGNHAADDLADYPGIQDAAAIASVLAANAASAAIGGAAAAGVPLTSIPALSSRPSATAKLYIDFNGEAVQSWGSYSVTATPAYDQDGDPTTFSTAELNSINEIWQRVSEKYSPFNIDVTTVDPGNLTNLRTTKITVGGDGAWLGAGAGGVAYVDAFTNTAPNNGWVFPKNLSNGYAKYVAEGIAHEAGHTFGLQHQSAYSGSSKTNEYNPGTSVTAPVMGNSYTATRGLWWYGSSTSSSTYQDDLSVLSKTANGFGYRTDDHSSSVGAPDALTVNGTSVSGSGVIEKTSDADYFSFTTGAGAVSLNVAPVLGGMLDARVQIFDASNNVVATSDAGLAESINTALAAGTYKLGVFSHGSYGDVGQYNITGTVQSPGTPVVTVAAPSALSAGSASTSQINLAWSDNSSNETGFAIERSTDGANWSQVATVGANSTSYAATGLSASTAYSFRARGYSGSTFSSYSNTASATTQAPPVVVTTPAAPSNLTPSPASGNQINITWTDNATNETGYKVYTYKDGGWLLIATLGANATGYSHTGLYPSTGYGYHVVATNSAGDSGYAETWSMTLSGGTTTPTTPQNPTTPQDPVTPPSTTAPSSPTGLALTGSKPNALTVVWTDTSSNETGFKIERTNDGVNWSQVGTTGANGASFTDTTVYPGAGYGYRVRATNGSGDSANSGVIYVSAPAYAVALDNASATGVTGTGTWYRSTSVGGYYGADYLQDGKAAKGSSSVVFTPTLENTGTYQVFLQWPAGSNRAANVPVDVTYAGGTTTVYVDQRRNGGTWVLLGTFNLTAGSSDSVRVRNGGTRGFVVADAVQFIQVGDVAKSTPTISRSVRAAKGRPGAAVLPKREALKLAAAKPLQVFSLDQLSSTGPRGNTLDDVIKPKRAARASVFSTLATIDA